MDPFELDKLSEQARNALRRGDDVRALAITDQMIAAVADDAAVRAMRAQALLGSDRPDEALAEAGRAVELDEENAYARRVLGLAAWRAGRLTLAQASLQRAIALSGRQPELLAEYAWFMANERGPRLAEEAAREALDADEASSTAWAALGLAQYKRRRRKEAESSLGRALQLNPNDLYAQSAMVVLLQDQRKDRKAEALADLLRDSPGTEEFVEAVHEEAKKRQIAKMLVERAVLPPADPGHSPRRRAMWVVTTALMIAGFCLLVQPGHLGAFVICVILPLVAVWCLRRLVD
jgi:Tfp pilus assembly protein PilF